MPYALSLRGSGSSTVSPQVHTFGWYSILSSAWLLLLLALLAFNTRIVTFIITFICMFWLLSVITLYMCWFVGLHYWLSSKVQQCYMVVSHWSQLYMIMSLIIHTCVTQFYWFISVFSAMYATDGRSERRTFIDLDYKHPNLSWLRFSIVTSILLDILLCC